MVRKLILSKVVLATLLAAGLAIPSASARESSAEETAARATVKIGKSKYGPILVDRRGRTLYLFAGETAKYIACTSDNLGCTKLWPPLLTTGKPRAGAGVNAKLLGTVRRTKPAGLQVMYNRHPLYFYADDTKPGDTKGQAQFDLWFVVSPKGRAIKRR